MSIVDWVVVISFFSYCGYVYYCARRNRRQGRN